MNNIERAAHAARAMSAYLSGKGERHDLPVEDYEISDLVCDLLHHGDRHGFDHQTILKQALMHYEAERAGQACLLPKHLYREGGGPWEGRPA